MQWPRHLLRGTCRKRRTRHVSRVCSSWTWQEWIVPEVELLLAHGPKNQEDVCLALPGSQGDLTQIPVHYDVYTVLTKCIKVYHGAFGLSFQGIRPELSGFNSPDIQKHTPGGHLCLCHSTSNIHLSISCHVIEFYVIPYVST